MKKNYTLIIATILLLLTGFAPQTWAVEYVLNTNPNVNINKSSNEFTLSCPGETLTFDLALAGGATGSVTVEEYDKDGNATTILNAANAGTFLAATKSYSATVSITTVKIKISASGTLSKKLQNVLVTKRISVTPSNNIVECGTIAVGGSSTDTKFAINWSNVNPLTLSIDNTTDFGISPMSINSPLCAYGSEEITVDFHPSSKGKKTATITVSNADKEWATITLNGTGDSIPQYISWWDESVTMLSRGDIIESPFVQASSGLPFTELKSTDESVLKIENGQLIAVAAGTADIIAYQAGDTKYAEARDTLHLEVTNLLTQKISWTQGLNFKWGDAATTLTATSSVGLPITYELVDNASNVVSLSGNVLTISTSNVGTATIKAVQAGNATYAGTSYTRTIRVRDPNASCLDEPFALDDMNTYSLNTIQKGPEMALDGWPDKLTFQAKRASLSANYFFVQQYLNGSWQDVLNPSLTTSYATYTCSLNRNATKIRFITKTGATLTKNYKNVQVTRAHFVEANVSSLNIEAQYGTTTTKTVRVNYSNIQDIVTTEIVRGNDEFRVTPATIGNDCGDYGTIDVQVIYTPSTIASDSETLRIGNEKDGYLNIPIATTVSKRTQNLSWSLRDSVATTQTWTLNKVNPVSGLPIVYEISDESIVRLDENNKLVYLQADTVVTITARCPGNDLYQDAEPITLTIRIFKGLPVLTLPTAGNTITYEQPLSDVTLEGGQAGTISGDIIAGDFMWTNKYLIPNAGEGVKYAITFVPYNQYLYDNVTDSIAIDVLRKAQSIVWSMPDSLGVMDSIALDGRATSNLPVSYALSGSGATYAAIGSDHALDITATTAALGTELVITATQAGNQNYLPADDVTFSIVLRKTRANFFAATEPISIPAGSSIALSEIRSRVHTESSVAGTWDFDASAPTTLNACIWTLKATFTPANLELCEIITVEIPINITAE
ncbi:MAG: hypothetical protein PUE55_00295 [Bacteroidales bacterium]|nr:hypothetical protein [Bacteroidales bacterium]